MGILDDAHTTTGSLVASTMETVGTAIQSDILDWITGAEGQMIAGMFFLFAIVGAIITFAVGGNYRWARYFLVGPALFLFLTDVRVASDGSKWEFGEHAFADDYRKKMLRGVMDFENGTRQGNDVAMFFQFWNVLMSTITQDLIKLVDPKDGSHLNFARKIERYMNVWNGSYINNGYMKMFVQIALRDCQGYFNLSRLVSNPGIGINQRTYYESFLDKAGTMSMRTLMSHAKAADDGGATVNAMEAYLTSLPEGERLEYDTAYSCQEMWEFAVKALRKPIMADLVKHLTTELAPEEKPDDVMRAFVKKIYTETSFSSSLARLHLEKTGGDGDDEGGGEEGNGYFNPDGSINIDSLMGDEQFAEDFKKQ